MYTKPGPENNKEMNPERKVCELEYERQNGISNGFLSKIAGDESYLYRT